MKRKLLSLLLCLSMLLSLCVSANAEAVSSEAALTAAIEQGTDVQLQNNITLSAPLTVEKTMTLDLNGKTLTYTGTGGSIITVKNATLTIIDSGAEYVDGVLRKYGSITSQNTATSEKGGGLYIDDGGTVELTAGALLECAASKNGGGVYVANGGKLHMTGDSMIQSCKAPAGGGMYIELGGIATMDGGRISSCTASREGDAYGGGVYLESPTSRHDETIPYGFRMIGGTIQNCSASSDAGSAYGGGVYIGGFPSGIFEMAGGSLIGCKATGEVWAYGGGVYLGGTMGKFTMTGGQITSCEAVYKGNYQLPMAYGGGVYVHDSNIFEMTGGNIADSCTSYQETQKTDNGGLCLGLGTTMLAHGGTVDCAVMNREGDIQSTDPDPSHITTFNSAVTNDAGTISAGTFRREVINGTGAQGGTISGGTFQGSVINGSYSEISGGIFHGTVRNEAEIGLGGRIGTIGGGSFDETPYGAFTVTFDVRGGTPVPEPQVRVNAPATAPNPDPAKDDQQFLGWYTDSKCTQRYEFTERILADTTLYALWSDDRCAVIFNSNGGSDVESQLLISGDKAAEPLDPTKEGATFLGWFTESGKHWNFTHDSVTGNITLRAMWSDGATPTPPTTVAVTGVTLDQTALTLAKDSSAALTAAVEPANATNKTVSWRSTDTSVAAVSSDGTVTAGKAGMALIVARTADGNYIATCTVTVPEDTPKPTHPAKPNIQVTGSYTYNGAVQTAKVTGYDPDTMNITGNTATNAGSCTVAVTSKTGKWADGSSDAVTAMWSIGKATQDAPTGLAGVAPSSGNGSDGKITGVTDRMEYHPAGESSYKACSGTEIESISAGTYFVRYAEDNNHFASPDATVTVGEGTPLADCEITFDPNGGTGSMKAVTVKAGTNYILPACGFTAPAGQKFKVWEIGGRSYNVGDPYTVNGDTRIKAVFEEVAPVAYYTLRFETDGGSAIASVRGTYNTYIDLIKYIPARHGHTFIGWYSDSSLTKRVSGVYLTEDTTVYAGWRTARNTIPDGGGNAAGSAGTVGRTDTKRLESQQTGDSSNLAVWSALLFASGTAIGTMAVSRRKKCGR